MDQLTGAEPYNVFNDFISILKDFYGRSPYKNGVSRYIVP